MERIGRKCRGVELGAPPIARAYMPAANDNFAGFIGIGCAAVVAPDFNADALGASADRNDRLQRSRTPMVDGILRDHPHLGRRDLVHENAIRERVSLEEIDIAREQGLAADIYGSNMRE